MILFRITYQTPSLSHVLHPRHGQICVFVKFLSLDIFAHQASTARKIYPWLRLPWIKPTSRSSRLRLPWVKSTTRPTKNSFVIKLSRDSSPRHNRTKINPWLLSPGNRISVTTQFSVFLPFARFSCFLFFFLRPSFSSRVTRSIVLTPPLFYFYPDKLIR